MIWPSIKFKKSSNTDSINGESETKESVIPVISVIFLGIGIDGFNRVVNSSKTSPFWKRIADISIISSLDISKPVVSRSKDIKSWNLIFFKNASMHAYEGNLQTSAGLILKALDQERRAGGVGPQVLHLIKTK